MRRSYFASCFIASGLALFAGCSSVPEEDELGSTVESELQTPCELGNSCPQAFKVLSAKSESSVSRNDVRDDVTVAWQGESEFPAALFSGATSRKLRYSGEGRVVLTGNAQGTAPIRIDDFLLVEVLAENGAVLTTAVLNPTAPVAVDGVPPSALAPMPAWGGNGQGWSYAEVDISSILPKNQTFRLRLGAYDVVSVALVTDVYLRTTAAAAPPPPPPPPPVADPFDPASCQGPQWTAAEALTKFAPATVKTKLTDALTVVARTRACGNATGCTAWASTNAIAYRHRSQSDLYGHLDSMASFAVPPDDAYVGMFLRQGNKDSDRIRLRTSFRTGTLGADIELPFNATKGAYGADVGKCTAVPCFNGGLRVPDYGDSLQLSGGNYSGKKGSGGLSGPHVITKDCMRLTGRTQVEWTNKLGRNENEYVVLARY